HEVFIVFYNSVSINSGVIPVLRIALNNPTAEKNLLTDALIAETVNPKPKNLKGCQLNRSTTMDSKSVHFSKDAMRKLGRLSKAQWNNESNYLLKYYLLSYHKSNTVVDACKLVVNNWFSCKIKTENSKNITNLG
ncbi:hypothetical protein A3Q56_07431, partial [Intoshia linei]